MAGPRFPRGRNASFDGTEYTLHGHRIVEIDQAARAARLDSCGWKTPTTKTHMNDCLGACGFPFRVYQERGEWYAWNVQAEEAQPFVDGMTVQA